MTEIDTAGWPGGISPPGSHRSGREPLDSSGSCHSAAYRRPRRVPVDPPAKAVVHLAVRVARPLGSSPITGPSSLLRARPPPCLATGTLPLAVVAALGSP